MPASLVTELQQALRTRLLSSAELRAFVSDRIYDQPPIDAAMPFIRFMGLQQFNDDVDGNTGLELHYGLVVESRPAESMATTKYAGRIEATEIAWQIRKLLHRQESHIRILRVQFSTLLECIHDSTVINHTDDEGTFMAACNYRITIEE